jgi:phage baseplate assembly protein W
VRGTLAKRYESLLRMLLLTPMGSLPWAPRFGTTLHLLRTQPIQEGDAEVVEAELSVQVATWVPDIVVTGVQLVQDPTTFRVTVSVSWILPSMTPGSTQPILDNQLTTVEA